MKMDWCWSVKWTQTPTWRQESVEKNTSSISPRFFADRWVGNGVEIPTFFRYSLISLRKCIRRSVRQSIGHVLNFSHMQFLGGIWTKWHQKHLGVVGRFRERARTDRQIASDVLTLLDLFTPVPPLKNERREGRNECWRETSQTRANERAWNEKK